MLAILYDIHGNLSALDAVIADARDRGADKWFIGGDVALFGPAPRETVFRLFELQARGLDPRQRRTLDGRSPARRPSTSSAPSRPRAKSSATGSSTSLMALPESHLLDDRTRAWHASPVSDVRSFAPRAGRRRGGAAEERRRAAPRLRPHAHPVLAQVRRPRRHRARQPGSVGMPFDGDHRAAYALMHDDGTIEQRRVGYDHVRVPVALRAKFGDAAWVEVPERRFETATLEGA